MTKVTKNVEVAKATKKSGTILNSMAEKAEKPVAEKKAEKTESFESIATRLLAEKASEKAIQKTFVQLYAKKGIDDLVFVGKRITIYMGIAAKLLTGKK